MVKDLRAMLSGLNGEFEIKIGIHKLKYYNVTSDIKLIDRDILLLISKCFDIKPKQI